MTVSTVVGCGYVGGELSRLLADEGHDVHAVSRSGVDIDGVESHEFDVTQEVELPESDNVFYLVSAGSRDPEAYERAYVEGLKNVIGDIGGTDADLVYSSSTGVYETSDGSWVDEETEIDPTTRRTEVLLRAEELTRESGGTVVRFAGLYGPERYGLDRYLDGARVPSGYLNLLHRRDAAGSLRFVAEEETRHDLYLAVDDQPVDRHELARWLAEKTGRNVGNLADETKSSNKRCSNERLKNEGWVPEYPNYREGYSEKLS
ncbi:MAG: sugar nucleotide-binding protein [Halobacteria archaeon]|nr:sugar nucleotide-binding protein [Halobacteria archaeon]